MSAPTSEDEYQQDHTRGIDTPRGSYDRINDRINKLDKHPAQLTLDARLEQQKEPDDYSPLL